MPDIFVPLDTTSYSDYYSNLIRDGILNQFVLEYVDKNRKKILNGYEDFLKYTNDFVVTDELLTRLNNFAIKEGLDFSQEEFELSKNRIALIMKAYIARDLWSTSEFYQIINQENENLIKAVEVLDHWELYSKKLLY